MFGSKKLKKRMVDIEHFYRMQKCILNDLLSDKYLGKFATYVKCGEEITICIRAVTVNQDGLIILHEDTLNDLGFTFGNSVRSLNAVVTDKKPKGIKEA